jgi:hypothetical protein
VEPIHVFQHCAMKEIQSYDNKFIEKW